MAQRFYNPFSSVVSDANKLADGGLIDTFENNSTTPKTTFTDEALTVLHANPIILNGAARFPAIFAADSDVFTLRLRDSSGATIIGTQDDYSGVSEFSLSSANVLAALAGNSAAVVINGASMTGSAFTSFASALTLTAAGSINASAGSINLGTVTGATTFSSAVTVSTGGITVSAGGITISAGDVELDTGSLILDGGTASRLTQDSATSFLQLSGGTSSGAGGEIVLFAENHATQANDFQLQTGGITRYLYDDSDVLHEFTGSMITNGDFTVNGSIFGGSTTDPLSLASNSTPTGGNIVLYPDAHSTKASDIELRSLTDIKLGYDKSASLWTMADALTITTGNITASAGAIILTAGSPGNPTAGQAILNGAAAGGAILKGYGTQFDAVLQNRSSASALGVIPDTTDIRIIGTLDIEGSEITLGIPTINSGTGTPEASLTAPIGSMYLRTDGGVGTILYTKNSGAGNTGWAPLT